MLTCLLWLVCFLMLTCFVILLPCVAYLFLWCLSYVFVYLVFFSLLTMTGYVFLLMLFWLSVSLLLCLFAVTDFVSCFGTAFTELFRPTRPLGRNKLLVICDFKSVVGNDFLLRYYWYLMFLRHQRELILVHRTSETDTACGWLCSLREGVLISASPVPRCGSASRILASVRSQCCTRLLWINIRQSSFYRQLAVLPSFILGIPGPAFCPVDALWLDRWLDRNDDSALAGTGSG